MNYNRRIIMLLVIALILIAVCACEPGVQPLPTTPPAYPAQAEGTVLFQSNSIGWNTYYDFGQPQFWTEADITPGADIEASWTGEPAVQRLPRVVAEGNADTVVWDLGENEVYTDPNKTWSLHDQLVTTDLLVNKTPPSSCVVMIKPFTLAEGSHPASQMQPVRDWMDQFAQDHPNVVLMDWGSFAPEGWTNDGTHIHTLQGAQAYNAMIMEGLAQCA